VLVGHDGVVAVLHVLNCGSGVVSFGRVGAQCTGVGSIKSETMHPAVIHLQSIISGDGAGRHGDCWTQADLGCYCGQRHDLCHRCDMQYWCGRVAANNCGIGTVVAELSCGELVQVLLVFACEMQAEFNERLVGNGADMPGVARCGEHACGL